MGFRILDIWEVKWLGDFCQVMLCPVSLPSYLVHCGNSPWVPPNIVLSFIRVFIVMHSVPPDVPVQLPPLSHSLDLEFGPQPEQQNQKTRPGCLTWAQTAFQLHCISFSSIVYFSWASWLSGGNVGSGWEWKYFWILMFFFKEWWAECSQEEVPEN